MSLLLKALKHADRGSALSLEPMAARASDAHTPPPTAQAAAELMFEKHAASEKRRLLILLGSLGAVVVVMGVYFYVAIFMPWVFLPKPPSPPAQPVITTQAQRPIETLPPLTQTIPAPPPAMKPLEPARSTTQAPSADTPKPRANSALRKEGASVAPATPDTGIKVVGGSAQSSGGISNAYQLLQDGRLEDARRAYEKLRALEPRNPDVLLGLALIAQRQGRADDAVQHYLKALEADPKNTFAQASLTGMVARADPQAAETKFKSLIAQQPAAYLYFGLGNVYAAQGRWNEAQNAYFDAQRLEPDSPDYAFNLAVSLEHINQPRAALDYYQRALKLIQTRSASFDVAQVKSRIQQLGSAK
ncbi:MAG: tetratricopeptide repeat protein [Hydrogenophilales bacterium]|nr:tetratricopeptide repeat protein [Hydrogenophilales bacterium]